MRKLTAMKVWILCSILFLFAGGLVHSQSSYSLADNSTLEVSGTSTLHDWVMTSDEASGQARMTISQNKIESIQSLNVRLKAESLKSGKSRMDNNAYSTLKTDDNPFITFRMTEVQQITDKFVLAKGTLTIAGNSETVTLRVDYKLNQNSVNFKGSHDITFTEYGMESPTAMLGTIRTGEDLTLSFDVNYSLNN